jgi:peptidoglycan/LPS O-acetylase OafA/YrhL
MFQRGRGWDRWLGELSYPIYIVHWSVMFPISYVWDRLTGLPGYQGYDETVAILIFSILAGLVLKQFVSDPLELMRDRVRKVPKHALLQGTS